MKLAFSTLGCPEWSWAEIIATAKDMKYDAIEIRGVGNELFAPNIKAFSDANIESTKNKLKDMKLAISCLTSACYIFDEENFQKYIDEGKAYIDSASKLEVPFVRVLGDKNPAPGESINDKAVLNALNILGNYAENKSVTILIETNGVYSNTARLAALMEKVESKNVAVLWDIHHPYRYFGESPKNTFENIGKYLKYVHVKDSVADDSGNIHYKMMGRGDLPLKESIRVLNANGYDGFVSLEWVKRWYSDLEAPGVVFMQYINYMKKLI